MANYYLKSSKTGEVVRINSTKAERDIAAGKVPKDRFFKDASLTAPAFPTKKKMVQVEVPTAPSESTFVAQPQTETPENPRMNEVRSYNPNTRQGIEKLQRIMLGSDTGYTPDERREAYRLFYSKVPSTVERIDFDKSKGENGKFMGKPIMKSPGRIMTERLFGRQAIERQLTDEGGIWEGAKSVVDYGIGLLDAPSRVAGAFVGKGDISDEGTYLLRPEYENVEGISEQIRNKYRELIETQDAGRAQQLETEIEDLREKIEPSTFREITGRILSDPGVIKSLFKGTVAGGKRLLKSDAKLLKRPFVASEGEDAVQDIVRYASPEAAAKTGRVLTTDKAGTDIVLDPVEVERLTGTLVEPPKYSKVAATLEGTDIEGKPLKDLPKEFTPASEARNARFEGVNIQDEIEEAISQGMSNKEIIDGLMSSLPKETQEFIRSQKLDEEGVLEVLQTMYGLPFTRVDGPRIDPRSLKDKSGAAYVVKGEDGYLADIKLRGKKETAPLDGEVPEGVDVADDNKFYWSDIGVLGSVGSSRFDYRLSGNNPITTSRILSNQFDEVIQYARNPEYVDNFKREPARVKDLVKKVVSTIASMNTETSVQDMTKLARHIDKELGKVNTVNSEIASTLKEMSHELRRLKSKIVEHGVDVVGKEAPSELTGKMKALLKRHSDPTKPFNESANFKEGYNALRANVKDITNVSKTLLESLGIKQTAGLSQSQWNKTTEKVNTYVKSILKNANSNKQKNVEEAIFGLERYLRNQNLKYMDIKEPLEEYIRIAEYADPVIKNGQITGFRMKSGDGLVDAIYETNKSTITKALGGLYKGVSSLASLEGDAEAAILKYLSTTKLGKSGVEIVARILGKVPKDENPSLGQIALARRVIVKALTAAIKTGRIAVSDREFNPEQNTNKNLEFDLSGTKEKK